MIDDLKLILRIVISTLPLLLFIFFNGKANVKKEIRVRQVFMPIAALVYCVVLFVLMNKLSDLCLKLAYGIAGLAEKIHWNSVADWIKNACRQYAVLVMLILFNTLALVLYVFFKRFVTLILSKMKFSPGSTRGKLASVFYTYDEEDDAWYIKNHMGQARTFLKAAYYGGIVIVMLAFFVSCMLLKKRLIAAPFYPVFALIVIGEMAFFVDGIRKDEKKAKGMAAAADNSTRTTIYPLLRKPLRTLFGDKLSSEGTTFSDGTYAGASLEDILIDIEKEGGHLGKNYAAFIRMKAERGLKPNIDYLRSGYDLSAGKSLLFNTPFYDKLSPYVFYAMQRSLLDGKKVLVVLGRHGTEEDLKSWCERGMLAVSNVPNLWKIRELHVRKKDDDEIADIGIISRSGVHDLDIHRTNPEFLHKVGFVFIVEPSRLLTTAQIGLNLLIKCCGKGRDITFCSVDQNCDGLVDSLSHVLMTNITEVSATEFPHGTSSYMCWLSDSDYLQHRIVPGVSRYLGIGTELSLVALKNQVERATWYGGETFPVLDAHWIAKQYYHDLLDYAELPETQETFDKYYHTSFNMCDERVSDYSYIVVEDERNNVFETKRSFATIAEKQGFVNVVSSEYVLREYMTDNTQLFNADAKAIPYLTADYARTKRNAILTLCLKLCVDGVTDQELNKELMMLGINTTTPKDVLWEELIELYGIGPDCAHDKKGNPIIQVEAPNGAGTLTFEKDETISFERRYSVLSGEFETICRIRDKRFADSILNDLQHAGYIAEQDADNCYIGTELKGHIYQKYLPGQFFTLNGKYYEMVTVTADNRILVRRASEHINGRQSYRQVRKYAIHKVVDSRIMGALKTVNGIDIYYQFADFTVSTPGYWRLTAFNDFENGDLVELNGIPDRRYFNKQLIKLDFSKLGDAFTPKIRTTLTVMLNEVFLTLFADNQPFICAVTPGEHDVPVTYSVELDEAVNASDNCIYIIEDSQLDIGLLITVERNLGRILQIIADYLDWNDEKMESSRKQTVEETTKTGISSVEEALKELENNKEEKPEEKKKGLFRRFFDWIKGLFKKKDKNAPEKPKKEKKKKKKKGKGAEEPERTDEPNAAENEPTAVTPADDAAAGTGVEAAAPEPIAAQEGAQDDKQDETPEEETTAPETPQSEAAPEEAPQAEAASEETPQAEATPEEATPPEKKGFFRRLFQKKDKQNAEPKEPRVKEKKEKVKKEKVKKEKVKKEKVKKEKKSKKKDRAETAAEEANAAAVLIPEAAEPEQSDEAPAEKTGEETAAEGNSDEG